MKKVKNKTKTAIVGALLLSVMLTGCAEQGARSNDPNAYAKVTYSNSYRGMNESKPEESSVEVVEAVGINAEAVWGLGKTFDELAEKYGDITTGNFDTYSFKNGYGIYVWAGGADPTQTDRDENIEMVRGRGGCCKIADISAKDFLIGDLSTVTLDNIAEKCGFDVALIDPTPDGETMYDGYKSAYFTHPDYKNFSFLMMYSIENGFDENAEFNVSYNSET